MAKQPARARGARTQSSMQRHPAADRSDRPAFIRAQDLRPGANRFTIGNSIGLFVRDDGSTALFIEVKDGRRTFTWALNASGRDRRTMQEQCGRNLLDWPGKTIDLVPVQGSRGGWFVNLASPDRDDDDIPF